MTHTHSFDTLHDEFRPTALKIALRFMKQEQDAEDVVQTVMISLWRQIQAGEAIRNPRQWFAEAVKNASLNALAIRDDAVSLDALTEEGVHPEPAADDFEEPAIDPKLKAALRVAIDQLPARVSEVMSRFYWGSQSTAQIALEMGISRSAVTGNLTRGRDMLRQMFVRQEKVA